MMMTVIDVSLMMISCIIIDVSLMMMPVIDESLIIDLPLMMMSCITKVRRIIKDLVTLIVKTF